ncbi:MAG: hypothetical protein JXA87_07690 [Thermoleophilia bacterium]|nr:hypothetical protein [Thermoleophilia bacterium]
MSDTPTSEAPDESPALAQDPGSPPEQAPPETNPLARDGFDLIVDGITEPYRREQAEQINRELIMAGADAQGIRARDKAEDRQLEEMRRGEEERQRQKEAEQRYRERLASALDEHEAAVALEAEPDKKSPKARRLAVALDAASRRSRTIKWAAPAAVALAIAVVFIAVFAGRGDDDPAATLESVVASVTSEAAISTTSAPAGQPEADSGPQSTASGDPYLEARAALGLSTTTPATVEHNNAGAGPMLYELSWVDRAEMPRAKLGSIGTITLTEDRAMQEGGRATLDRSDSVGAYVIGKEEGQVSIGVRIAIRVPGPDGGEPRLTIFSLENTDGSSLVGTAKPHGDGDVDMPWYVLGERVRSE